MNKNTPSAEPISEPIVEAPVEIVVGREERDYRDWKKHNGDFAFSLVELLRGRSRHEVSLSDIVGTQLYKRSNSMEQAALRFVCSESPDVPATGNDLVSLRLHDQLLMDFSEQKLLGHRDFQNRILNIPERCAEKRHFDERTFPFAAKYQAPKLFEWVWHGNA